MGTLRISVATDAKDLTREEQREARAPLWQPPTYTGFQAPVPKSPDYSTPAKVIARIREFVGHQAGWSENTHSMVTRWDTQWFVPATRDRSFAKLYREFVQCVKAAEEKT